MKIFNFGTLQYDNINKTNIVTIPIQAKFNNLLDNNSAMVYCELKNAILHTVVDILKQPELYYHFEVSIIDPTIDSSVYASLRQLMADIIFEQFKMGMPREREKRLGIPTEVSGISKTSKNIVLNAINNKLTVDKFAITIDINGKKERMF